MNNYAPLLAPKPFAAFSPEEFRTYVRSLYEEPVKPPPPPDFSVRLNARGTPVITVRREPKWLTRAEVVRLAAEVALSQQEMWLAVRRRKIEVRLD